MSTSPEVFDTRLVPADLDLARPRPLETPWGTMALYFVEGRWYCSQAFCPHLEGPLFQGTLSGTSITCPWHQWRYDLCTGRRVDLARPRSGPEARSLVCCEVTLSPQGTLVLRRAPSGSAS